MGAAQGRGTTEEKQACGGKSWTLVRESASALHQSSVGVSSLLQQGGRQCFIWRVGGGEVGEDYLPQTIPRELVHVGAYHPQHWIEGELAFGWLAPSGSASGFEHAARQASRDVAGDLTHESPEVA